MFSDFMTGIQYKLPTSIEKEFIEYKKNRAFNAKVWVSNKVASITQYMNNNSINAVVIGISGGIDSAVTHALLQKAAEHANFHIYPYSIPIKGSKGTTGQKRAIKLAQKIKIDQKYSDTVKVISKPNSFLLDTMFNEIANVTKKSKTLEINDTDSEFAKGQLDYYLRPMYLYGIAAMLSSTGLRPVVCGTINKTEASLGYFGKKTDSCDIQLIHDLYKTEVYEVAEYLGVDPAIIYNKPEGGLYTSMTDEECIGAPYKFIEMYLEKIKTFSPDVLVETATPTTLKWIRNINQQIATNKHKFSKMKDSTLESILI